MGLRRLHGSDSGLNIRARQHLCRSGGRGVWAWWVNRPGSGKRVLTPTPIAVVSVCAERKAGATEVVRGMDTWTYLQGQHNESNMNIKEYEGTRNDENEDTMKIMKCRNIKEENESTGNDENDDTQNTEDYAELERVRNNENNDTQNIMTMK